MSVIAVFFFFLGSVNAYAVFFYFFGFFFSQFTSSSTSFLLLTLLSPVFAVAIFSCLLS